jgi:predicted phosphodiesterase
MGSATPAARRVAVLADIHGNVDALEVVLSEVLAARPDLIVVCGDVSWGPFPRETIAALLDVPVPMRYVLGNADRFLLEPAGQGESELEAWMREQHDGPMLDFLRVLEPTVVTEVAGMGTIRFCHGSPRSDTECITVQTSPARMADACAAVPELIIACAHTHMQFDRRVAGRRVFNPGSVGLPYEGRTGAFWATVGPGVRHRATEYSVSTVARRIRGTTYPGANRHANLLENPPAPDVVIADAEERVHAD